MKRIGLFISANPRNSGVYQYTRSILTAFLNLPDDVFKKTIICTDRSWEKELSAVPHADIIFMNRDPFWWIFRLNLWLLIPYMTDFLRYFCIHFCPVSKRIHSFHCDLWIFPAQDTWAYLNDSPSIAVIHDLMHRYEKSFREVGSFWECMAREKHFIQTCKHATAIVVESETGKKQVIESYRIKDNKIFVLPYVPSFTDVGSLRINDHLQDVLPQKFIFYPAQFWEHKNHKNLVLAIDKLRHQIPDIHAVFAGAPKNGYSAVMELISSLRLSDHFTFLGYVPDEDMPGIYRSARALIYPTFFGPTNIPPLEAFSIGCPSAVSDIYGMSEQVGDASLLFKPHHVDEIADAMYKLWTDNELCKSLIDRGKERTKKWNQGNFDVCFANIIRALPG